MQANTIYDMLLAVEGGIIPIGETNCDDRALRNLDAWSELYIAMTNKIIESADGEAGRYLKSVKDVSDKARRLLREIYEDIGYALKEYGEIQEYTDMQEATPKIGSVCTIRYVDTSGRILTDAAMYKGNGIFTSISEDTINNKVIQWAYIPQWAYMPNVSDIEK